jgi:diaminohydroxyphosphoribosylaminopyrimidine deaminase/5-amino-6-(5-phosphoribosylamino)uracil reductase
LQLLDQLGRRRMTNILVEGGSEVLGSFLDARQIDEIHAFLAPKLVGGQSAPSPIGGEGIARMSEAIAAGNAVIESAGGDVYVHSRIVGDGEVAEATAACAGPPGN